jgi:spermidine synthase
VTAAAQDAPAESSRSAVPLNVLVFVAGVGSLATEIGASRLLAPYYGSSTVVWANVIGLVLASLALGYWLGGRVADRRPSPRLLGAVVMAAAVGIAAIPFLAKPFLDVSVQGLDDVSAGAAIGSFFAVLALFAPPVTLLGMVAPFAIRLGVTELATAGAVAGRFYALSTLGSLLGTFLSALVAIPLVGTQRTLLASAALIACGGAALLGARWLAVGLALGALTLVSPGAVKGRAGLLYEHESRYQYVQVVQSGEERRLYLDEGLVVHSVWRPDTVLTGGEWDMFLAVPPLLGPRVERVAILGNAGGTTARAFGVYYPHATIDGVELDPAVTAAGRRLLGLDDNPRLHVHTADARPFLRRTGERYDLVFVDAYRPPYVPFYLATREFFRLVRARMQPGGILALNVATVPSDHRLARAVGGTMAHEFPAVFSWQALRFNQLVVGLTTPLGRDAAATRLRHGPGRLRVLTRLFAEHMLPVTPNEHPWTDDRSPVEWVTDRMIVEWASKGGAIQDRALPTAP